MTDQVQAVQRRLVSQQSVDFLMRISAWGPFNRETIADALVICGGDVVITHKLFQEWHAQHERPHSYKLPEASLLAYLRTHAPAALQSCPCGTCRNATRHELKERHGE